MPYLMSRIDVPNVDAWTRAFETLADDGAAWRRHRIYRSLEEPEQLVIALGVDSYEDAVALRAELPESRPFAEVRFAGQPRMVDELEGIACPRRSARGRCPARGLRLGAGAPARGPPPHAIVSRLRPGAT